MGGLYDYIDVGAGQDDRERVYTREHDMSLCTCAGFMPPILTWYNGHRAFFVMKCLLYSLSAGGLMSPQNLHIGYIKFNIWNTRQKEYIH